MSLPRLFLVAPEAATSATVLGCSEAACSAGDVASLVVTPAQLNGVVTKLQALGVAVLVAGGAASTLPCDGVQVGGSGQIKALRKSLANNAILGAYCGVSRHAAMQAGEDGADYVALDQSGEAIDQPIIAWWSTYMEVPCVAYEPVTAADLDILLPQNPDFIRPSDEMWQSADAARRIVSGLMQALKGS